MSGKIRALAVLFALTTFGCSQEESVTYSDAELKSIMVLSPTDVNYQPLNPARGDASPQAGVLWGDIRENVPSGVLLKFAPGFASPPHIHNITYRAVVISGEVHNDDPKAANMWMGPGAFWTQPAGEVHITSARPGAGATAFLEILEGPYLVQPGNQVFDHGERPLNLAPSNMVWMEAQDLTWIETQHTENGPKVAWLWGEVSADGISGSFVKLPVGYAGQISTTNGDLKAVVIKGTLQHTIRNASEMQTLSSGAYFASAERIPHSINCGPDQECLIYLRTKGRYRIE